MHTAAIKCSQANLFIAELDYLDMCSMWFTSEYSSHYCVQAFGAKRYALVGHIWQRAIIIMGLLCIPISVLLMFTEPILLATRQTPTVAAMTASYIRYSAVV